MDYVMVTGDKAKYQINEKEKNAIFEAIKLHESHVVVQGDMIPLQIIPSIMNFQRWWATESEKLIVSGKRLCRLCLKVFYINDVCKCWESTLSKKQQAFKSLPDELPTIIKKAIGIIKDFPQLTDEDKAQIEIEEIQPATIYVQKNGMDGYVDPESGDEIFS